ncbi:MAG: hypothetical protein LBD13_06265 [Spirochaetaceae bacterium]|jgi:hypothetical protein|nr:hypothetical protein [Spirochaetaceae bacterium]
MSRIYVKPAILVNTEPAGIIPAILGVGMALGSALGMAASASAALGGLAVGAAAGAAGAGVAALAKKAGNDRVGSWERLPALDAVEAYS